MKTYTGKIAYFNKDSKIGIFEGDSQWFSFRQADCDFEPKSGDLVTVNEIDEFTLPIPSVYRKLSKC